MMGGSLGGWSQGAFGQSANSSPFARGAEVSTESLHFEERKMLEPG